MIKNTMIHYCAKLMILFYLLWWTSPSEASNPPKRTAKQLAQLPYCHTSPALLNPVQCMHNNSYCGEWHGRFFYPLHCQYRNITAAQSRQCLRKKTIACIGDWMTRDLCLGLNLLLTGKADADSDVLNSEFDISQAFFWKHATKIEKTPRFMERDRDKDPFDGIILPTVKDAKQHGWDWQLQIWDMSVLQHAENTYDVLNNLMVELNNDQINLHTIDLAIWQQGVYNLGFFQEPPVGERFRQEIMKLWLNHRAALEVPVVWASMNPKCDASLASSNTEHIFDEVNRYVLKYTREQQLPYFDTAMPMRLDVTGQATRCAMKAFDMHTKIWVEVMRARILLDHLCDEDMNWRGGLDQFIHPPTGNNSTKDTRDGGSKISTKENKAAELGIQSPHKPHNNIHTTHNAHSSSNKDKETAHQPNNPALRSPQQLAQLPYCHTSPALLNPVQCAHNNSYCGEWHGRFFYPLHCQYRNITVAEGRKCMRNRTLACIGDSMTRDLCVGLYMLLSGKAELDSSSDEKFDKRSEEHWQQAMRIDNVPRFIQRDTFSESYEGMVLPKLEDAQQHHWDWQIQIWEQNANYLIDNIVDILNNKLVELNNATFHLRKLDFGVWQHGAHDWGWYNAQPYGPRFVDGVFKHFLDTRGKYVTPVTWMSMNPNCKAKIGYATNNTREQPTRIEDINRFILNLTRQSHIPYFDTALPLRVDTHGARRRCRLSSDGLHVKMWVDVMRAKILLNHLCDDDMQWIADTNRFIHP